MFTLKTHHAGTAIATFGTTGSAGSGTAGRNGLNNHHVFFFQLGNSGGFLHAHHRLRDLDFQVRTTLRA